MKPIRSVSHRLMIAGKRWTIRFVQPADLPDDRDGDCSQELRLIRIALGLSELRLLEVIAHEVTHAACWDIDEEAVERIGDAVSRSLYAFGFRHSPGV